MSSSTCAGCSTDRKSATGCSTPLSKIRKSVRFRSCTNRPCSSLTVTPTFTRFTFTRKGGPCPGMPCGQSGLAARSRETAKPMADGCLARFVRRQKQKALHRVHFSERSTGPPIDSVRNVLRLGRRSGGSGCSAGAGILRRRKITGNLVFADVEYHHFIRRHARRTLHVKLHRFARSFVLLFYGFVVRVHRHRVFGLLLVHLVQRDLHGANSLRRFGLRDGELVVVAFAAPLQVFQVVVVARNQAAHHAHIPGGPVELALGGFQVVARGLDVLLCPAQIGCYDSELLLVVLLRLRQLRAQFLVRRHLFLADRFRAALGLRQLGGRQS